MLIECRKKSLVKVDRDTEIDMIKGLGIMLVVMGHVSENTLINKWIYSFHMPVFFYISGCVCYMYREQNAFLKKKTKSLLIPYFIFSITTFIYWVLIERTIRGQEYISVIDQFIGIFIAQGGAQNYAYNIVMWFLPCLFLCEITFYAIRKVVHKKIIICITLLVLSIIGLVINHYINVRLPWSMDVMFIAIIFYGSGYLSYEKIKKIKIDLKTKNLFVLSVLLIIHIYLVAEFYMGCDMNNNFYSEYFFVFSFGGIGLIYLTAKLFDLKLIKFLGVNSLVIMGIHEPLKRLLIKIISVIAQIDVNTLRQEISWIIVCSVVILVCMYPLIRIIKNVNKIMKKHTSINC